MRADEIVDDNNEIVCHAEAAWIVEKPKSAAHWFGRLRKVDDGQALYEALTAMTPLKLRAEAGGTTHDIILKSLVGAANDEAAFVGSGPPPLPHVG